MTIAVDLGRKATKPKSLLIEQCLGKSSIANTYIGWKFAYRNYVFLPMCM